MIEYKITTPVGDQPQLMLIQTAEELPTKRFIDLKRFIIVKETGVDIPSLHVTLKEFLEGFDLGKPSQMIITLHNYLSGLTEVNKGNDADQLIFSLIVLEPGEDPTRWSIDEGNAKMQRLGQLGLTQGEVHKTVENFISASPLLSGYSLVRTLENLKEQMHSLEQSEKSSASSETEQ